VVVEAMSAEHFRWDEKVRRYIPCTEEEGWESEGGKPMELGPVYVPPTKKLLTDTGTRFEHLNDLLDYLGEGIIAVQNSLKRYDNENDALRLKRLESAATLIQIYQNQMANVDGEKWAFNNMLDKCAPERGVLETIRRERIEALKTGADQKSLPARPLEDTGNDLLSGAAD
jgi:hypothetical protein